MTIDPKRAAEAKAVFVSRGYRGIVKLYEIAEGDQYAERASAMVPLLLERLTLLAENIETANLAELSKYNDLANRMSAVMLDAQAMMNRDASN